MNLVVGMSESDVKLSILDWSTLEVTGTLPWGNITDNTKQLLFCCQTANSDQLADAPFQSPFYLLKVVNSI